MQERRSCRGCAAVERPLSGRPRGGRRNVTPHFRSCLAVRLTLFLSAPHGAPKQAGAQPWGSAPAPANSHVLTTHHTTPHRTTRHPPAARITAPAGRAPPAHSCPRRCATSWRATGATSCRQGAAHGALPSAMWRCSRHPAELSLQAPVDGPVPLSVPVDPTAPVLCVLGGHWARGVLLRVCPWCCARCRVPPHLPSPTPGWLLPAQAGESDRKLETKLAAEAAAFAALDPEAAATQMPRMQAGARGCPFLSRACRGVCSPQAPGAAGQAPPHLPASFCPACRSLPLALVLSRGAERVASGHALARGGCPMLPSSCAAHWFGFQAGISVFPKAAGPHAVCGQHGAGRRCGHAAPGA